MGLVGCNFPLLPPVRFLSHRVSGSEDPHKVELHNEVVALLLGTMNFNMKQK